MVLNRLAQSFKTHRMNENKEMHLIIIIKLKIYRPITNILQLS